MNIRKRPATTAILLITAMLLSSLTAPSVKAASQLSINNAVIKGLAYLNSTQQPGGYWCPGFAPVACTAEAVLAFEQAPNNHFGWNLTDPYHTTVQKGLDWLFSIASIQTLTNKTAGDPCINGGSCVGVYFSDGQPVYETPMVLEAIVAAERQNLNATIGPTTYVNGNTYHNIVVEIVQYLAWAQNDVSQGGRGGWRYGPQYGSSDNSVTQWPTLGLLAAENWGINAPAFVKTELFTYWTNTTQQFVENPSTNYYYGAFGYTDPFSLNSLVESASGILQLTYSGIPKTDYRIRAAEGYIVRDWLTDSSWRANFGDFYAMYGLMKAARLATDKVNSVSFNSPIKYLTNYTGAPTIEWYNGTGQYADYLVTNQASNGHWTTTAGPEYIPDDLTTAWGVLILEFVPIVNIRHLTVNVYDSLTGSPIAGAQVLANGPLTASGATGIDGSIHFTFRAAGVYIVNASATGYFPPEPQTVNLVSAVNATVTIRLQPIARPLQITKFFTDSSLNPLAKDSHGNPMVNVVMTGGTVRGTNPGQVIAWVNVTNTAGVPLQSLKLNETLPVDWRINPSWTPGLGAIHVYYANATSLSTNPEITQPSTITVTPSNPETVHLAVSNFTATKIGHSLAQGQSILLSVKMSYALTKSSQSLTSYPRNYTDTATAVAWTQPHYTGIIAKGTASAFFIAYAKVEDAASTPLAIIAATVNVYTTAL